MWGDADRWAGWCIEGADRAWRVFLPLVGADGAPQPWPFPADALDGQLWWPDVAGYPAAGGPAPCLEPASGAVQPGTLAALVSVLTLVGGEDAVWRHVQEESGPPRRDVRGTLTGLSRTWTTGFAGRAWCPAIPASVAAPAYADSLVVAGPARLGPEMTRRGLQVAPVAPSARHRLYVT